MFKTFLKKTPRFVGSPKHFLQVICFLPPFFLKFFIKSLSFKIFFKELFFICPSDIESSYVRQHGTTVPVDCTAKILVPHAKLSFIGS